MIFVTFVIFLDIRLKFQLDVWNGCIDELMMSLNFIDISILDIHGDNHCCLINKISKKEAIQNMIYLKKVEHYKT